MSSLLVFNRVNRLEIQSVMLVFSTGFFYCCHSNLLYTRIHVYSVQGGEYGFIRGGGEGSDRYNTCLKVPLQVNFFYITTFGIAFYHSSLYPRSGHLKFFRVICQSQWSDKVTLTTCCVFHVSIWSDLDRHFTPADPDPRPASAFCWHRNLCKFCK